MNTDVFVIGAGPSGLLAALQIANSGKQALVCEHSPGPMRKLLLTGGGRCNLTNRLSLVDFTNFFGPQAHFIRPALKTFSPGQLIEFMKKYGIECTSYDSIHVYPASEKARDVSDAIVAACKEQDDVDILTGMTVTSFSRDEDGIFSIHSSYADIKARAVVVATGGKSYPGTGSDGSGYAFAESAGHTIVEPVPALTDLKISDEWLRACTGMSLPHCRIAFDVPSLKKLKFEGDVLITHEGISGPAALDASGEIARLLLNRKSITIKMKFHAGITEYDWDAQLTKWQQQSGGRQVRTLLAEHMPSRLAQALCLLAGIPFDMKIADLKKIYKRMLMRMFQEGVSLTVTGTGDFDKAMITSGGVSRDEVDPRTLMSRKMPGLFFCGEILDVNGPCGGFNLQWAFSSGVLAGKSAVKFLKEMKK